jgi:hypothetical protein
LPDGIFSDHKSQFGSSLDGLAMEDVGMYILWKFDVCTYFKAILYIFWPFGILGGNLVYFSSFWYVVPKIWQPWNKLLSRKF